MHLHQRLDALQHRIAAALRALPGASALYLFGSRLTHPDDPYADLDLQIVSDDLATTRRYWPHFLERIAPIRFVWPLTSALDNTAFAVLFRGEHPFHKVDIGLSATAKQAEQGAATGSYRLLWQQLAADGLASIPPTQGYLPTAGTVGHALLDELISSVRYVKARKRGQLATCWRFVRGKPDLLFRLRFEQQRGWSEDLPPLSTWDYKALDKQYDPLVAAALGHLDWSAPQLMDASFVWFTHQIVELLLAKATARQETIPPDLVSEHLTCIARELGQHREL